MNRVLRKTNYTSLKLHISKFLMNYLVPRLYRSGKPWTSRNLRKSQVGRVNGFWWALWYHQLFKIHVSISEISDFRGSENRCFHRKANSSIILCFALPHLHVICQNIMVKLVPGKQSKTVCQHFSKISPYGLTFLHGGTNGVLSICNNSS
jgi:hypothetical protein